MNIRNLLAASAAVLAMATSVARAADTGFYAGPTFSSYSGTSEYLPYSGGGLKIDGHMFGLEGGWNGTFEHIAYGAYANVNFGSEKGHEHSDYGGGASDDHTLTVKGTASFGLMAGVPMTIFGVDVMPFGQIEETFGAVENKDVYVEPGFNSTSSSTTFGNRFNWHAGAAIGLGEHWMVKAAYGTSSLDLNYGHDNLGNHWGQREALTGFTAALDYRF